MKVLIIVNQNIMHLKIEHMSVLKKQVYKTEKTIRGSQT